MSRFHLIAVIQDRTLEVLSDGTKAGTMFIGAEQDIKRANATAHNRRLSRLGDISDGPVARAGFDTALGLAAALYSVAPQSTYLSEAPEEVQAFLDKARRHCAGVVIESTKGRKA